VGGVQVKPSRRGSSDSLHLFVDYLASRVLLTYVIPCKMFPISCKTRSPTRCHIVMPLAIYTFSMFYKSGALLIAHLPSALVLCLGYCTSASSSLCNPYTSPRAILAAALLRSVSSVISEISSFITCKALNTLDKSN